MPNSNEYVFNEESNELHENERRKSNNTSKRLSSDKKKTDEKIVVKRQRKTRPIRDTNAPRMPLNGYVRFLNAHRDRVKTSNPNLSFAEITKLLASEWSSLGVEQKKHYLSEAEKAKEKYLQELQEYQRTEAYQEFVHKQKQIREKTIKSNQNNSKPSNNGTNDHNINVSSGINEDNEMLESFQMDTNPSTLDLPIFTEEFLDHNKLREQELRQLRKLNTEYEEQNAILSKHIDNMKSAIEKLEVESVQQKNNNAALNQHLTHLRTILSRSFSDIPIPGSSETPNMDNIDEYMIKLHSKLTKDKNRETENLLERIRAIVSVLDYNLQ